MVQFEIFLSNLKRFQINSLGGIDAQVRLVNKKHRESYKQFRLRNIRNARKAAVVCLFYPNVNDETCFLLTKRASYNGHHSSQICFPGGKLQTFLCFSSKLLLLLWFHKFNVYLGKVEKSDSSYQDTALREVFEEIGISNKEIKIFRRMTELYIPPSNFLVQPFLGEYDIFFIYNLDIKIIFFFNQRFVFVLQCIGILCMTNFRIFRVKTCNI